MSVDTEKLAKVLGKLGSNNDNEVLVAARAAERMVRSANMSWDAVVVSDTPRDVRKMLLAIDRRLEKLHLHDQRNFVKIRAGFFKNGRVGVEGERRLRYYYDLAYPYGEGVY